MKALFFLPSFYGFCAWLATLALFHVPIASWHPLSMGAYAIFGTTVLFFGFGTVLYVKKFQLAVFRRNAMSSLNVPNLKVILTLHLIGFCGLAWHIFELSRFFGSVSGLMFSLLNESYLIRQSEVATPGTQLTYFGWLAIWLTAIYLLSETQKYRRFLWMLMLMQFFGNMVYIDRTRPLWILFVAAVVFLLYRKPSLKKTLRYALLTTATMLFLFSMIAAWTGKVSDGVEQYGSVRADGPARIIYLYVTSGFSYFSEELQTHNNTSVSLSHSMYPLAKVMAAIGLIDQPESQVLEELAVPFPTNVGTFLDPYLRDGGVLMVVVAIFIHALVFNAVGLLLLRRGTPLSVIAWANLCFANVISFFVPKAVSIPMWLFVMLPLFDTVGRSFIKMPKRRLRLVDINILEDVGNKNDGEK